MAADDFIDAMNDLADKTAAKYESVDELLAKPKNRQAIREMMEALKTAQKSFPVSSFSERSLNDYLVRDIYGKTVITEAKGEFVNPYWDAVNSKKDKRTQKTYDTEKKLQDEKDKLEKDLQAARAEADKKGSQARELAIKLKDAQDKSAIDAAKFNAELNKKMLVDQDVKKFNEMAPSLLIVKFNKFVDNGNGGATEAVDTFIAGVKSRLISTDAIDIAERLVAKNKTKLSFVNLIRATTGEISFINDFLLCTKQAKIDAKNAVKKGPAAKMWSALEYRATKNQSNK